MELKIRFVLLLVFCTSVQSASIFENSYNYVVKLGRSLAPNLLSMIECVGQEESWGCAREKAGKMLDIWNEEIQKEQKKWEEEADAEIRTSGRSLDQMPSKVGREITDSMNSLTEVLGRGMARALERKKHDQGGGIDSITISTAGGDKKKMKKKKQKPPKIHLIHPMMVPMRKAHKEEKGRNFGSGTQSWVIGERTLPATVNSTPEARSLPDSVPEFKALPNVPSLSEARSMPEFQSSEESLVPLDQNRGVLSDFWGMGQDALDTLAEHVVENENLENGIQDKSTVEEQRGKKKKKKKAILKLLILGAVIKAKIGTLLQILTYKLQIKFFVVALLSFFVNVARLWIDIKNKSNTQKDEERRRSMVFTDRQLKGEENLKNIIYYEHAQHQHHYDHEEEEPSHGWGPWSRSMFPDEEIEVENSDPVSPYQAQERQPAIYNRPYLTRT